MSRRSGRSRWRAASPQHHQNGGDGKAARVRSVDANANFGGNQSFAYIGGAAFTGAAGQLRAQWIDGELLVMADLNGDRSADFMIRVEGVSSLSASDFVL